MPQELNVLCCCSCNMFQVHIVKKEKKWQCKICNEKQSLQRVYFKGSGKDCRVHVQNLNSMKQNECQMKRAFESNDSVYNDSEDNCDEEPSLAIAESKWSKYLDSSESSASKSLNDEDSYEADDNDIVPADNDELSYVCSESESSNSTCSSGTVVEPSVDSENGKEYCNFWEKEAFSNADDDDDDDDDDGFKNEHRNDIDETSVTNSRKRKRDNIFEDDEDFDVSIDF